MVLLINKTGRIKKFVLLSCAKENWQLDTGIGVAFSFIQQAKPSCSSSSLNATLTYATNASIPTTTRMVPRWQRRRRWLRRWFRRKASDSVIRHRCRFSRLVDADAGQSSDRFVIYLEVVCAIAGNCSCYVYRVSELKDGNF